MSQGSFKLPRKDYLKPSIGQKAINKDQVPSKPESQMKFKTEFCRNLEAGFCEFGDKCFFAHTLEELREKTHSSTLRHVKCKNYFESGYCMSGSKCQFSHREISPETATNSPNGSGNPSRKGSGEMHRSHLFIDLESRSLF